MSSLPLKTLIMATTVFTFTACTPNSDPVPQKETVQNQHHAHHSPQTTDKQQQTPNHKTAYTEAMHKMHQAMMAANAEKDPDIAFVQGMIPHHQGAIEMAKIELQYGKDPEIRQLAEQVLKAQQPEIDQMNQWLNTYQANFVTDNSPHIQAYIDSMADHDAMQIATQHDDPDIAFVQGMIPHHQGAVDMANIELKYGKDEQMRKLAQDIINAQQTEIDFMNQWLAKKNPSPQQTQSQSKPQP